MSNSLHIGTLSKLQRAEIGIRIDEELRNRGYDPEKIIVPVVEPSLTIGEAYKKVWSPNPGPQVLALDTEAYETGYGGQAGGGKSDLLLGIAITRQMHSQIFRRESVRLKALEQRSKELLGHKGYNATDKVWNLADGRIIEFGHCEHEKDKEKWQGRAGDFKGFDELTQFTESQFLYLMGWNRSVVPDLRCRVVTTFNPPQGEDGAWVIDRYAPWIDKDHENPAQPGELRWFIRVNGKDTMVDGPEPLVIDGDEYQPLSRTFIPAALSDNPFLIGTSYQAVLDQMPEPLRSQLKKGDFGLGLTDDAWGVLPGSWVQAAMDRWTERPPKATPDHIGIDPSRGGGDRFSKVRRHGTWYSHAQCWEGEHVNTGPKGAMKATEDVPSGVSYSVDVIGIGSSVFDSMVLMGVTVDAVNVATGSDATDSTGTLTFRSLKEELWWKFREALDPENGLGIALPPDKELKRELCAPRFTVMAGGVIVMEKKADTVTRIGRSPDKADATVLASRIGSGSAKGLFH